MTKINESQKWPTDKERYDRNYLKIFGKKCPSCDGQERGVLCAEGGWTTCPLCNGLGYVEQKNDE
jgi:hypothetical protein